MAVSGAIIKEIW